jgi:hypothetical protein
MLKRRMGFTLRDNAFTALDDPQAAQKLAEVAQLVANSTQKCVRNRGISRFFGSETGVMSM